MSASEPSGPLVPIIARGLFPKLLDKALFEHPKHMFKLMGRKIFIIVNSVYLWKYDISDPTLVDLTSNSFVLCTNVKVHLYNYS